MEQSLSNTWQTGDGSRGRVESCGGIHNSTYSSASHKTTLPVANANFGLPSCQSYNFHVHQTSLSPIPPVIIAEQKLAPAQSSSLETRSYIAEEWGGSQCLF